MHLAQNYKWNAQREGTEKKQEVVVRKGFMKNWDANWAGEEKALPKTGQVSQQKALQSGRQTLSQELSTLSLTWWNFLGDFLYKMREWIRMISKVCPSSLRGGSVELILECLLKGQEAED